MPHYLPQPPCRPARLLQHQRSYALLQRRRSCSYARRLFSNRPPRFFVEKRFYYSSCCLNNNLRKVTSKVFSACEAAAATKKSAAVVLPPDLDVGGHLRMGGTGELTVFDDESIKVLKQHARDQWKCRIIDAAEVPKAAERINRKHENMAPAGDIEQWLYRQMKLPAALSRAWEACYSAVSPPEIVLHARVEQDWYEHPCHSSKWTEGPSLFCHTPKFIARQISRYRNASVVLIHGDLATRYKEGSGESPREVWPQVNPGQKLHYKKWIPECSTELSKLKYNQAAFLDFWLALQAKVFVGNPTSSFSEGVYKARKLVGKEENYDYNCKDEGLRLQDGTFEETKLVDECRNGKGQV